MRKLLFTILCTTNIVAFASIFDSANNLNSSASCMNKCNPGSIMQALGDKVSENSKSSSQNICKAACLDKCFSNNINQDQPSETAAIKCKDSLKSTLGMK